MNFHVVPQLLIFLKLFIIITVKEYERVVGWEGSDAVSPPRDGAAWALRNTTGYFSCVCKNKLTL